MLNAPVCWKDTVERVEYVLFCVRSFWLRYENVLFLFEWILGSEFHGRQQKDNKCLPSTFLCIQRDASERNRRLGRNRSIDEGVCTSPSFQFDLPVRSRCHLPSFFGSEVQKYENCGMHAEFPT